MFVSNQLSSHILHVFVLKFLHRKLWAEKRYSFGLLLGQIKCYIYYAVLIVLLYRLWPTTLKLIPEKQTYTLPLIILVTINYCTRFIFLSPEGRMRSIPRRGSIKINWCSRNELSTFHFTV